MLLFVVELSSFCSVSGPRMLESRFNELIFSIYTFIMVSLTSCDTFLSLHKSFLKSTPAGLIGIFDEDFWFVKAS